MAKKKLKTVRNPSQSVAGSVKNVLRKNANRSDKNPYLTAYQILEQLPERVRKALIDKHKLGGKGANADYAATEVVAKAAMSVTKDIVYLDTCHATFTVQGQQVIPSGNICGLYRLPPSKRKKAKKSTKKGR